MSVKVLGKISPNTVARRSTPTHDFVVAAPKPPRFALTMGEILKAKGIIGVNNRGELLGKGV